MNGQKNQGHSLSICHPYIKFEIRMYGVRGVLYEPGLFFIVLPYIKGDLKKLLSTNLQENNYE